MTYHICLLSSLHATLTSMDQKKNKKSTALKNIPDSQLFLLYFREEKAGEGGGRETTFKAVFFILVPSIIEHDRVFPPLILHLG